jgi:hypothetical protein
MVSIKAQSMIAATLPIRSSPTRMVGVNKGNGYAICLLPFCGAFCGTDFRTQFSHCPPPPHLLLSRCARRVRTSCSQGQTLTVHSALRGPSPHEAALRASPVLPARTPVRGRPPASPVRQAPSALRAPLRTRCVPRVRCRLRGRQPAPHALWVSFPTPAPPPA